MKRSILLIGMLLALVWTGSMAQSPTSEPVNYAEAIRFTEQHPQYAKDFIFTDGKAVCNDAVALAAFKGSVSKVSTSGSKLSSATGTTRTVQGSSTKAEAKTSVTADEGAETPLAMIDREINAIKDQLAGRPSDPSYTLEIDAHHSLNERLEILTATRNKMNSK